MRAVFLSLFNYYLFIKSFIDAKSNYFWKGEVRRFFTSLTMSWTDITSHRLKSQSGFNIIFNCFSIIHGEKSNRNVTRVAHNWPPLKLYCDTCLYWKMCIVVEVVHVHECHVSLAVVIWILRWFYNFHSLFEFFVNSSFFVLWLLCTKTFGT